MMVNPQWKDNFCLQRKAKCNYLGIKDGFIAIIQCFILFFIYSLDKLKYCMYTNTQIYLIIILLQHLLRTMPLEKGSTFGDICGAAMLESPECSHIMSLGLLFSRVLCSHSITSPQQLCQTQLNDQNVQIHLSQEIHKSIFLLSFP